MLDVNAILYKIYPSMINFILLSYQLRIWIGTLRAQTLHIEIKINRNYSNLKLYIVTSRAFFTVPAGLTGRRWQMLSGPS